MESGEISAIVVTGVIMAILAFASFKIGKKIGDNKK